MKQFRLFLKLFLAVVMGLPGVVVAAQEADLELIHADGGENWYINTRTLVNPAPGTVSFWNKIVFSKGSPCFAEMERVLEKAGKSKDRLEYVQVLQELECATSRTKVWNVVFYDRRDRIIYSSAAEKLCGRILAFMQEAFSVRDAVCSAASSRALEKQELLATLPAH